MSDKPEEPVDPMAFADAEVRDFAEEKAKRRRPRKPAAVGPGGGQGGDPPKSGAHRPRPLPPGCPVVPLGFSGSTRWYLDARGQLRGLAVSRHIKLEIQGLFCDQVGLVFEYWTRISATTGKPEGWHPERAAADLLVASGAQSWSPAGRARGRGCWLDDRGHLVVHVGDAVLHDGEWKVPGKIGDMVYLAGEPVMRPAAIALPGQLGGPGQVVLDLFSRWNFSRKIDERLMLGMFVGDFLSGALPWRVAMWIYGEKETGKSTLIDTKEALSGGWQLGSEDSTAAGIWQLIGYDALSLALDEAGDDAEPRRVIALLRLVRVLTGRGNIIRGGADHQGHQFTVGSSITLSSILRPPMLSQDASRIVPIQVLKPKASLPQPAPETLRVLGAQILQRAIDGWDRYPAAHGAYLAAFASVGCADHRTTRNYVTLLALAHIVLVEEEVDAAVARGQVRQLVEDLKEEAADALSSSESWLHYLRSRLLPFEGVSERLTIYELIRDAALSARSELCLTEGTGSNASATLRQIGIVIRVPKKSGRVTALAIANEHAGLIRLHQDTPWGGGPGRRGGWIDAARGLPGAERCKARFLGPPSRGISIPLDIVLGKGWETGATAWMGDEDEPEAADVSKREGVSPGDENT